MKSRKIIQFILLIMAFSASILVLRSSSTSLEPHTGPCEETLKDCCKETREGKMIWEGLSNQFYSSF